MGTSTIKKTVCIEKYVGELENTTGDYTISHGLPYVGFVPIASYYFTTYSQYRPLSIGFAPNTDTLVIQDATASMSGRPYILYGYNSN